MELERELRRIADAAVRHAAEGEELTGIVPAEPGSGVRAYVCAFTDGDETSWLVLDADGHAVEDRSLVRDAVSIAALYELAEEATGAAVEEPRVAPSVGPDRESGHDPSRCDCAASALSRATRLYRVARALAPLSSFVAK